MHVRGVEMSPQCPLVVQPVMTMNEEACKCGWLTTGQGEQLTDGQDSV